MIPTTHLSRTRSRTAFLAALALAAFAASVGNARAARRTETPPIRHVFVIVLENEGYDTTFGLGTRAPYLADTLVKAGALLRQYYGTGHFSLDNYLAMISGMAPTLETQSDCPRFQEFAETGVTPDGQPIGHGCVYPAHVQTIANQLAARGLTWKAFMEDMGADSRREHGTCGHPPIGAVDSTQSATPTDQYATKHDPFVYFHSIIDTRSCGKSVVPLTELASAIASARQTPNFSFITPNLCHDGHDSPCANGEVGGLKSADAFLRHVVPLITRSAAFREDGLLIVTFDEALTIDPSACCSELPGPNVLHPGFTGPGGGRIGAVLLSPFIAPGTVSDVRYNHYAMLRSIEDLFSLAHLGYAGQQGLVSFGTDVFARARPGR